MPMDPKWREAVLAAGVRVLLKRALGRVGGYWTQADTAEALAEQARRRHAPVEEVVDQWAAAALVGTVATDSGQRRPVTEREGELMHDQARRCLELFRGVAER